jgi:hypothetical protein
MDRRRDGGWRQERPNGLAGSGLHPKGRNEVEDPARSAGLRPGEAGPQGSDATRQIGAARPDVIAPQA